MRDEAEHKGVKEKPPVPWWRWPFWGVCMLAGVVIFYILLTPIWIGLRALAWAAEFRARRRSPGGQSPPRRG